MDIHKVGVVGCGQMGSGIAETAAVAGYAVVVTNSSTGDSDEALEKALQRIRAQADHDAARGRLSPDDREALASRLHGVPSLDLLHDCDLVVEAIVENMDDKKRIFAALDRAVRPGAILASTTSSLSITELGMATSRPDKVAGCHFFHPVLRMPLLEIVCTISSSNETIDTLKSFGARLGKTTVVAKDRPGFIVSSLLIPYLLDAIRLFEHGLATRDDIDTAMKLGCNLPMGPLVLCDFIGNDTVLYTADAMYSELHDPRYAAPPLLRRMVMSGLCGRKSGKGFYEY